MTALCGPHWEENVRRIMEGTTMTREQAEEIAALGLVRCDGGALYIIRGLPVTLNDLLEEGK